MSQTWTACTTPYLLLPGGCSCPWLCAGRASRLPMPADAGVRMAGQGTRPLRSSAWKARQCCQLLLSCAAPFWPALVFVGLSHETCSSIKRQKTIIFKNWLNSLPFKRVKLPCRGDQKMLRPAKGKEEGKKSSLCLSARSSVWTRSPQANLSAGPRAAVLGRGSGEGSLDPPVPQPGLCKP